MDRSPWRSTGDRLSQPRPGKLDASMLAMKAGPDVRASRPLLLGWALALAVVPALSVAADADLWWHLLAGREILEQGSIPRVDAWSYTATGAAWTNHEWLPDVVLAGAYGVGGELGLLAVRAPVLVVLLAAWLATVQRRLPCGLCALVLLGIPWIFVALMCNLRPHTVTWALVPLALWAVDRVGSGARWAPWFLVALVWAWTNLHGGFLFGWGVASLGLALTALGLEGEPPTRTQRRERVLAIVAATAFQLLNPFGTELHAYVLRELLAEHPMLPEWQPPTGPLVGIMIVAVALPWLAWAWTRARLRPTAWVAFSVATLAATQQAKMITLVLLLSPICLADALAPAWARIRALPDGPRLERISSRPSVRTLALAALMLGHVPYRPFPWSGISVSRERFPVEAVAWLSHLPGGGRLLVPLGWGGLALSYLSPRWSVSMDGRNTAVYPVAMVNADTRAWHDEHGGADTLLATKPDAVLAPTQGSMDRALRARPSWRAAYRDPTATVWLPAGAQRPARAATGTAPARPAGRAP